MATINIDLSITQTPPAIIEEIRQFVPIKGDKGDSFTFNMFTPEQLLLIRGNAFTYADFTPEQLLTLKGLPGKSITSLLIDVNGHLQITMSDATVYDAGYIAFINDFLGYALSDATSDITAGVKLIDLFVSPFTVTSIVASLATPATGGTFTINIKKNGVSIFATKLTIDINKTSNLTSSIPYVLTGPLSFAVNDTVEFDVDIVGTTIPGKGLIIKLIGHK